MSPKAEMPEQFIGKSPNAAEGLVPVGSPVELKVNSSSREVLDSASVEVRFGDPMVDAPRLLELFTQSTTIEHLANIRPFPLREHYTTEEEYEKIYRERVDETKDLYKNNTVLLTAETPSGLIVGAYAAQRPGRGSRAAEGGLLAVDEKYRRKGIATKLIKAGNALMLREGDGGFDCNLIDIYVIFGVNSYSNALDVFEKEGFEIKGQRGGGTHSWSYELEEIVDRTSLHLILERRQYKQDFPGEHITFFPKPRPPKVA